MRGWSISHWSWLKRPDARIEDGLIINGDRVEHYHPGEHQNELLNALQGVSDESTALEFVQRWGPLGYAQDAALSQNRRNQIEGAIAFTYAVRKADNPDTDINSVKKEVLQFFNPKGGYRLTPKGDPVQGVIRFAQRIKHLSEARRLLRLYREDEYAATYEAKEWIETLSPEWYELLIGVDDGILQEQYGSEHSESQFYQYVLGIVLSAARRSVTGRSQRGIWVELNTGHIAGRPEGFPVIQFDALFRFIEYTLLIEGSPSPKRCTDPKCRQLFFPTRSDQEYCPPPPGVKRSRCENRHGQVLRRNRIRAGKLFAEGKSPEAIGHILDFPTNQIREWIKE